MFDKINNDLQSYYHARRDISTEEAQAVGWKNEDAQRVRFEQLIKIISRTETFVINDLGCGFGHFADFLTTQSMVPFQYQGYDLLPEMIDTARTGHAGVPNVEFISISDAQQMKSADYTVASGIFNLRYSVPEQEWLNYILDTLAIMHDKSTHGFAFNVLTSYSDTEYMKSELYYADPLILFDYCKKHFSKNVALLHDYYQYDFTILVRKV